MNLDVIKGGDRTNVIPDFCQGIMDIRYRIPEELDRVLKALKDMPAKIPGTRREIEHILRPPLIKTAESEKLYEKINKLGAANGIAISQASVAGGSDVANITTTGEIKNGKVIINGEKMYISGALEAKKNGGGHLTLLKTDKSKGHTGITMVYVPTDAEEIEITKLQNMGRMGISTSGIKYNNVEVPEENIIGKINEGFYYSMDGFNHARIMVAAACNGLSVKMLDEGIKYIKERNAFGKKLGDFEAIAFEAADLKTEIEMACLLNYKSAYMADMNDPDFYIYSSMSKLTSPQIAMDTVKKVMMRFGAYSYTKDSGIERSARGIFSYLVGAEGALNIMKMIISRSMLK